MSVGTKIRPNGDVNRQDIICTQFWPRKFILKKKKNKIKGKKQNLFHSNSFHSFACSPGMWSHTL